ncbi:hypothetical protein PPROV_000683600 [Pycnococcus provasolii]|uniref:Uncharacterized protein n=1 Tax=Pycnococcus provasolii TaxID=41880 RepID=A0A830HLP1_9CHLO|nr:hypothetical protein PPROV_000683600 [Pycnococcus provasolii]
MIMDVSFGVYSLLLYCICLTLSRSSVLFRLLISSQVLTYHPFSSSDSNPGSSGGDKSNASSSADDGTSLSQSQSQHRLNARQRRRAVSHLVEDMAASQKLAVSPMTTAKFNRMPFAVEFEQCTMMLLVCVVNAILETTLAKAAEIGAIPKHLYRRNVLAAPSAMLSAGFACYALARTSLKHRTLTPSIERYVAAAVACAVFPIVLVSLTLVGDNNGTWVDVPLHDAAQTIETFACARARASSLYAPDAKCPSGFGLPLVRTVLSCSCAAVAASTLAAALRCAQTYHSCLHPPHWLQRAGTGVNVGATADVRRRAVLNIWLLSPLPAVLLYIPPLLDALPSNVASTAQMQALALAFAAVAQLVAVPTLLQANADKSFHRWYELKHGGEEEYKDLLKRMGADKDAKKKGEAKAAIMDAILESLDRLFGKVAVQATAPALIFVGAGALMSADAELGAVYRTFGGFVGSFACAWWFLVNAGAIWLRNTGLIL